MFARIESSRLAIDKSVSDPVFALRNRNSVANRLAIHEEAEARAFEARCHIRKECVFTSFSYFHSVFHPFASLRKANGIALAVLRVERIGTAKSNNIHAVFAIDIAFVHKILVVEGNALAAFIVIFHFNHARNRHIFDKGRLRNSIGEICKRNVVDLVTNFLEFTLKACRISNRSDIATVVAFCKLARLITANTARSIPVRVIFDNKATRTFVEVNRENPVIRPLGGTVIVEIVFLDFTARTLITQSVNRTGIAEQTRNMMNVVLIDMVVRHSGLVFGPAKPKGNSGVVSVGNFVVFNHHIARIASTDTHSALVFVRHVGHEVVANGITCTDFILVLRIVSDMNFSCGVLIELAKHNTSSANFIEHVAFDHVIIRSRHKVKASCGHLRKGAVLDQEMVSIFDTEAGIGTPQQILVAIQPFPISATGIRKDIHIEVCRLQIQEAFFAGASVVGMSKVQAFKRHITNFVLGVLT